MSAGAAHTLYRFWGSADELLYVGRTVAPSRRWRQHEKDKEWFNEVAIVTREVYPTAEAVDQAERTAIADECPRYNIALNRRAGGPRYRTSPHEPVAFDPDESVERRWAALGIDAVVDCLGDESVCECATCHASRVEELDGLAYGYEYHPNALADVRKVQSMYFAGHWLADWYYDFSDLGIFIPMMLAEHSQAKAVPAHAAIDDSVLSIDCPICLGTHRHVAIAGALLDAPLEAGCPKTRARGGRYLPITDWSEAFDALHAWGAEDSRRGAA